MVSSRICMALGLGMALVLGSKPVGAVDDGSTVVAEIGGHKITLADLDQKEAASCSKPATSIILPSGTHSISLLTTNYCSCRHSAKM
jgi:hypothetical protein